MATLEAASMALDPAGVLQARQNVMTDAAAPAATWEGTFERTIAGFMVQYFVLLQVIQIDPEVGTPKIKCSRVGT